MSGLLAELGKSLAERWLSLLVLPGALFLATLSAARQLGHTGWYEVGHLVDRANSNAETLSVSATGSALLLIVFLLAAAACGVVAQAAGSLLERLWLAADWPQWPAPLRRLAHRRVVRRQQRYRNLRDDVGRVLALDHALDRPSRQPLDTELDRIQRQLSEISDELPHRPTWMGDRIQAVDIRLRRDLGLALAVVWPHLWLHFPESTRSEVTTARAEVSRAAALGGWGLLYLAAGALWWPGLLVTAIVTMTAWHRARTATDSYATLVEAAVRLHVAALARRLGLPHGPGPFTRRLGGELTDRLRRGDGQL
ncbi:hypothetical protein ACFV0C_17155 [Streptomyces sp. NPDC059568]|uniref:hypothetical protein n=1 Tax=Streptomyces sp. NPDC059568 TaxID=3346868 RepID=UPI00369E5128